MSAPELFGLPDSNRVHVLQNMNTIAGPTPSGAVMFPIFVSVSKVYSIICSSETLGFLTFRRASWLDTF